MIIGAFCLNMSSNTISSADAFSLSGYYDLNSVESAVNSNIENSTANWKRIETCQITGDAKHMSESCHFIIGNGIIGSNGQIVPTELWQQQSTFEKHNAVEPVIRIGLLANSQTGTFNQLQSKRAELLADRLSRKFNISSDSILVPIF